MGKDLLYKPSISHSESYYSEGFDEIKEIQSPEEVIKDKSEKIKLIRDSIRNKGAFLPGEIINSYLSPLIVMDSEYKEILNDYLIKNEEDKKDDESKEEDEDGGIVEVPDNPFEDGSIFDKEDDVYIDIEDPFQDIEVDINDTYVNNFIEIYEDYMIKLENVLNNFVFELIEVTRETIIDFESDYITSIEVKNKNIIHLTDFIVKSNLYIRQAASLHKKLFSIDESIFHIKAPKVAKEQLLRYTKSEKLKETSETNIRSNILLKESTMIAEKKYNDNTRNLYKYLDSQVILLRDSLTQIVKQVVAASAVNKNEKRD